MSEEYLPFFFYGTLRPRDYNYLRFLEGRTQNEEAGYNLPGVELYDQGSFPVAREVADPNRVAKGDLIIIAPELYREVLADIDMLEGYIPRGPDYQYDRVARKVTGPDGQKRLAWIYFAEERYFQEVRESLTLIPDGDWLAWKKGRGGS